MQNRIVKNTGWLIYGKTAQMLINLLVGLLTARYLGPSNYGLISYGAAYTGFFFSLCTLGINTVLVKELLDQEKTQGQTLGTALLLQAVSSVVSALVILSIVCVADRGDLTVLKVVSLTNIGMILQVFGLFNQWFQSRLQSKVSAVISLIAYAVMAGYKVFLLVLGKSVEWFAFAGAVDHLCVAVLLCGAYRRYGGQRLSFSARYARSLLKKSCHFILPGLMVAVYSQTDKIMLKQMLGEAETGYYTTAISLCNVWCFVLSAMIDSFYPVIAQAHKTDKGLYRRRNKQLYAAVFYLSILVSGLISLLAGPIVRILYGETYLPTVAPLRIITWYTAFSYLGVARNAWVVCENRQRWLKWVYLISAVCNVALNLVWIPAFGAAGAALASLVSQVVTALIAPLFVAGLRENTVLMLEAISLRGL
ncbi:MAG: flippase [Oscillospiraceae bacterium]|nr:flippase [Oscillospiraceae bacterium]